MDLQGGGSVVPGKVNLVNLASLRASIKNSELCLPEFQRPSQRWSLNEKKELVVSLCMGLPIGSFLIWQYDENEEKHDDTDLRAFDGQKLIKKQIKYLLIDGQQRMEMIWDLENSEFGKTHKVLFQKISGGMVRPSVQKLKFDPEDGTMIIDPSCEIPLNKLAGSGTAEISDLEEEYQKSANQFRTSVDSTTVPAHIFEKKKDRQWVMFVYQTSNLAGKALQQEDYAEAAFAYLKPKFPEELQKFLDKQHKKWGISGIEKKLSRKVLIRCMLDELYNDSTFSGCRKNGLDLLNIRIIKTHENITKKVDEDSDKITSVMIEESFDRVKKSFELIGDLLTGNWKVYDASCLTINELIIMSTWYRTNENPNAIEIGLMSKWMMISMATKPTTGGSTQQLTKECCELVRNNSASASIEEIKEILGLKELRQSDLGNANEEVQRGKEKSALGKNSMVFHIFKLHLFREGAEDLFDSTTISYSNHKNLNVDHFYPNTPLGKLGTLKYRRNHIANFVLMKEWNNKSKGKEWPDSVIQKNIGWSKSKTEHAKNFKKHCIPTGPPGDVGSYWIPKPNETYNDEEKFTKAFVSFLNGRSKKMIESISKVLNKIERNGF